MHVEVLPSDNCPMWHCLRGNEHWSRLNVLSRVHSVLRLIHRFTIETIAPRNFFINEDWVGIILVLSTDRILFWIISFFFFFLLWKCNLIDSGIHTELMSSPSFHSKKSEALCFVEGLEILSYYPFIVDTLKILNNSCFSNYLRST